MRYYKSYQGEIPLAETEKIEHETKIKLDDLKRNRDKPGNQEEIDRISKETYD